MTNSIMLVGVGGQGTILAGKILTIGLMEAGYDVKMSEIHGMSQRGGSVTTHIRYSHEKVYSPVIEKGTADVLVAFEKMEALRYIDFLKKDGKIIVNDLEIPSTPITNGMCDYPQGILDELQSKANVTILNAGIEAHNIGSAKVMNIILLGALIKKMNLDSIDWTDIITKNVKSAFVQLNLKAIKRGMEL
ncbi:MAG: indolepyruvate oxidoreductase subunit beta [Clostridia bacterium]